MISDMTQESSMETASSVFSSNDQLLVIIFVNDNHLSNVISLKSVFNQDFPAYQLVLCNDCTDAFQCERLLFNVTDHTPLNCLQVHVIENRYHMGEVLSVKKILDEHKTEYTYILHSGESLKSSDSLSSVVSALEEEPDATAAAGEVELYNDSMKRVEKTLAWPPENGETEKSFLTNSMFLYRSAALSRVLDSKRNNDRVFEQAVPALSEDGAVLSLSFPLSYYSKKRVTSTPVELPDSLGNERLQRISSQLEGEEKQSAPFQPKAPLQKEDLTANKEKRKVLWFYKRSRFSRIKSTATIVLLLLLIGLFLLLGQHTGIPLLRTAGLVVLAVAALLAIWIAAMICCNLYFRKHPERLVS